MNLLVPVSAPGAFGVVTRLLDRDGKELAKAGTDIRVGAGPESRVKLGADGFLRLGGKARRHSRVRWHDAGVPKRFPVDSSPRFPSLVARCKNAFLIAE